LLILSALMVSTLLWARLDNPYVWIVMLVTLAFGLIGFADDYAKVTKQNTKGVSSRVRFLLGLVIAGWPPMRRPSSTRGADQPAGLSVLQGCAGEPRLVLRALRHGRDRRRGQCGEPDRRAGRAGDHAGDDRGGHAWASSPMSSATPIFADYLEVHFVPGTGELAGLCRRRCSAAGPGLPVVQRPPAAVFMGDTGSLALGGALGAIAVCTKHEIVLAIVGGLFVVEALSVIIQVAYYKRTKKRIFLMAPIHHHFEKKGWAEPQIVIRFWIISLILA
jgi:phospho-N-acetylmuramoyl-pentapeptide-transferase